MSCTANGKGFLHRAGPKSPFLDPPPQKNIFGGSLAPQNFPTVPMSFGDCSWGRDANRALHSLTHTPRPLPRVSKSTLAQRRAPGKVFAYFPPVLSLFPLCPRVGDSLLFENGCFDASFTFVIWCIRIFTQFHPFSNIFCLFPPHPVVSKLISPHHGGLEKARVM